MPEYIEREAFVKEQRHLYCENCARRKGMKNGKMRFVYEIGDAPCRACGYGDVLDDLEDYPAADVQPVVRAHWYWDKDGMDWNIGAWRCSACKAMSPMWWNCDKGSPMHKSGHKFCPNCGADMREES